MNFVFFIIGFVLSCICWWLGGFDFDTRGSDAVNCFATSLGSGVLGIIVSEFIKLKG
jgi:hypothetical protein